VPAALALREHLRARLTLAMLVAIPVFFVLIFASVLGQFADALGGGILAHGPTRDATRLLIAAGTGHGSPGGDWAAVAVAVLVALGVAFAAFWLAESCRGAWSEPTLAGVVAQVARDLLRLRLRSQLVDVLVMGDRLAVERVLEVLDGGLEALQPRLEDIEPALLRIVRRAGSTGPGTAPVLRCAHDRYPRLGPTGGRKRTS
jgi:hypothetical protein